MRDDPTAAKPKMSRRKALTTAAGIGVTVVAAGVIGVAAASDSKPGNVDGPVVVHLRDLSSGLLDVFVGARRVQVRDKGLAAQLARAARA